MLQSKDIGWLIGEKPRSIYMLPTRNSLQSYRYTQTESKRMEKRYFMQTEMKRKWV